MSATFVVTQKQELHTRVKTFDLQTLPRLCFEPDREKREESLASSLLCMLSFHLSD